MNQEKPSPVEISPELRIRECVNFDELYSVIQDLGEIQGSKRTYTSEEVVERIKKAVEIAKMGAYGVIEDYLARITDTYKINTKVRELISKQFPRQSS